MTQRFSIDIWENPEGFEIDELEGELYTTDYSDLFFPNEKISDVDVGKTIEQALEIIHGRQSSMAPEEAREFHGLILVLADIYGRDGELPLAIPIGGNRLTTDIYVKDAANLADTLYGIGIGKEHDGAIIVDKKTGRIVGYHVWLLPSPFNHDGVQYNGNGDGTRKSIAQQYSDWAWVDAIYTISESDGRIRKYTTKKTEKLRGPYKS